MNNLKKTLTKGPNDAYHVFWARYRRCSLYSTCKYLLVYRKKMIIKKKTHIGPKRRVSRRLGLFSQAVGAGAGAAGADAGAGSVVVAVSIDID